MKKINVGKVWMRLLIVFIIAISIPILLELTNSSSLAQVLVQPIVRRIGLYTIHREHLSDAISRNTQAKARLR